MNYKELQSLRSLDVAVEAAADEIQRLRAELAEMRRRLRAAEEKVRPDLERVTLAELAALRAMLDERKEDRAALEKRVRAEEHFRCVAKVHAVVRASKKGGFLTAIVVDILDGLDSLK